MTACPVESLLHERWTDRPAALLTKRNVNQIEMANADIEMHVTLYVTALLRLQSGHTDLDAPVLK